MNYKKLFQQDEDPADYGVASQRDLINKKDLNTQLVIKRIHKDYVVVSGVKELFSSSNFDECVTFGLNWEAEDECN
jgi:hypothetical protein